ARAVGGPGGGGRGDLAGVLPRPATRARIAVVDPYGGDDARRWTAPQEFRDELRPGVRRTLEMDETRAGRAASRLRVDTEIVGIGWLHLPSGPREVVLQRALVLREPAGARGFACDLLVHRFIDPEAGVVAVIEGPATSDGRGRSRVTSVTILDATIASAANLKIHVSENSDPVLTTLFYGWDRGSGT